ncbi:MAG TPA: uroporphyrinogen decarboxylase [Coxiellaceae bacterium]|nr:MAG: uroporphyrinogen decarboxylase [Gammaproteobacteria bacterium RIFCSPHIGHO2_12_FULL_36_30]HLB56179.1 uroporphyrinogen decarboxylase [Coxiellaceae bacterium]
MKNDRFIKALLRESIDRTPIWLMRQAGRYLPEYRALRSQEKNFFQFCQMPELACEATLQPIKRFPLDAAIIFSDILTVPLAMNCEIKMDEGRGPFAPNPIRTEKMIHALNTTHALEKLHYVSAAIQLTKKELDEKIPLIGFAGSPWTVATYMVEGQSSKTFEIIKSMLFREPKILHQLLEKISDVTIQYLNAQINAGADVIMLFDSWGGVLSPHDYQLFSLDYMKKIGAAISRKHNGKKIPLIFFSKGCGLYLENIADAGCDAVGIDWTMDLKMAREKVGDRVALQGNLDPSTLFASPEKIQLAAKNILSVYNNETGFVFNLGHGISKDTPIESVAALMDAVVNY